jgi:hypothetical protein
LPGGLPPPHGKIDAYKTGNRFYNMKVMALGVDVEEEEEEEHMLAGRGVDRREPKQTSTENYNRNARIF